jgi:SulP family sulfate permease
MIGNAWNRVRHELHPDRLFPSLIAGLVSGTIMILVEISLAALIFSGDLSAFVSNGIGITLFSSCVVGVVVALTSSFRGTVGVGQDIPAAILALTAAAITAVMPASASPEEKYATVIAAISLTSAITGIGFLLMGAFRLGGLIRYIPYPVIGGFLAGTGWVLVNGSFGVMAGASLTPAGLAQLFQPDLVVRWLPGLVFAMGLYIIARRFSHFLIIPGVLLAACLVFYGILWGTGTSLEAAKAGGWLLGPFPQGALWRPITLADLALVDWQAILGNAASIGTVLLVSAVALLLNASGLELTVRQDMDLDHELRSSGLANLLTALGGGTPGFQTLSLSALGYRLKAESRLFGLVAAGLCGLALFFGGPILSLLPKPVIGGLLLFLGLSFLVEWIYDAWFKLSRGEYAIVILILITMNAVGVLEGVGLGILFAVGLFVLDYSRTGVVKHAFSGESFRSNVDRPKMYSQILHRKGELVYILELQGFIFFGTANKLLAQVRQRVEDAKRQAPRFLLLDFRQVSGLDASAILSFNKMKQLAQGKQIILIFTGLSPEIRKKLDKDVLAPADAEVWKVFEDLQHGMAWCEEQIIAGVESVGLTASFKTILQQLDSFLPAPDGPRQLKTYCEKMETSAGQVLIEQGKPSSGLFFIETGGAEATLQLGDGRSTRLRKMSAGTIVGEIGVYSGRPATATVTTDQAGLIYFLSLEKMKEMERKHPDLAAAVHKFIAQLMSERLIDSTDVLEAMLK